MWGPAATAFEQAAQEAERAQDPRRPDLLVQAGNAWLAVDEIANAIRAFDAALATSQLSDAMRGEVHLDRARARVALDDAAGARADVDQALQLVAADPFAWYMSSALARRQNDLARARSDIARAMQLAPDNPDIPLLGGTLAGIAGNMAEAERLYAASPKPRPTRQPAWPRAPASTLREVEVAAPCGAGRCGAGGHAAAPASVEIEFDRRHDPHLLEGRVAGAIAFLGRGAVARADREIALGRGANAADGGARSLANRSAPRRASWVAKAIICGLMSLRRVKTYWMPEPSWMATPRRIRSNWRWWARRARATSVVRSWMRRLIVTVLVPVAVVEPG